MKNRCMEPKDIRRLKIGKGYLGNFFVFAFILSLCCSCQNTPQSEKISYDFVENYKDFEEILETQGIEAEIIVKDDTEYLLLTFPDQSRALYKERLERIEQDLEKEEEGWICSGELVIKIDEAEEIADVTIWIGEDAEGLPGGWTGGEFVLPDFSEMLPDRGWRDDDVSTLRSIKRWIPTEQMAELYKQAKDMEQRMMDAEDSKKAEEDKNEEKHK